MADDSVDIVIRAKAEIDKAFLDIEKRLKDIDDSAKNAGGSGGGLSSFTSGYSKLTSVLGIGAISTTAVTAAIGVLARQYVQAGSALVDLSAKTDIGIVQLGRMKFAAEQNGATLEQTANAATELSKRIAEGEKSTVGALGRLGISIDTIKKLDAGAQFELVASKIAGIPDQGTRASTAIALMGSVGAALLPVLTSDMRALGDEGERLGAVMSEKSARAADDLGDAWEKLTNAGSGLAARALRPLFEEATAVIDKFLELRGSVRETDQSINDLLDKRIAGGGRQPGGVGVLVATLFGESGPKILAEIPPALTKAREEHSKLILETTEGFVASAKAQQYLQQQEQLSVGTKRKAEEAIKAQKKATEDHTRFVEMAAAAQAEWTRTIAAANYQDSIAALSHLKDEWTRVANETQRYLVLQGQVTAAPLKSLLDQLPDNVPGRQPVLVTGITPPKLPEQKESGPTLPGFGEFFAGGNLASFVLSTLQGGGNLTGAIGGGLGSAAGGSIAGALGASATGFLGTLLPGAGGILGSLGGKLLGSLFGQSEGEKTNDLRDQFIAAAGGLHELNKQAVDAGLSLDRLLAAKRVEDLKAAMTELSAGIDEHRETMAAAVTESLASILAIAAETGTTVPESLQPLLAQLEEMGLLTDAMKASFGELAGGTEVDFKRMQQVAEQYGVDLQALGPRFQSARLSDIAHNVIRDFEFLTNSGTDVGTVLVGMKDEIGRLVGESIKFGTAIPENMRPWIENLIHTNQLVDANGVAITDLSQIQFSDPIKTGFERVAEAIERLNTILTEGLPNAAATARERIEANLSGIDIPPVRVPYRYEREGEEPAGVDLPGAATGIFATSPTVVQFGEGGEPELGGPVSFMARALAGAMQTMPGRGLGGHVTIVNNNDMRESNFQDVASQERFVRRISEAVVAQLSLQHRFSAI